MTILIYILISIITIFLGVKTFYFDKEEITVEKISEVIKKEQTPLIKQKEVILNKKVTKLANENVEVIYKKTTVEKEPIKKVAVKKSTSKKQFINKTNIKKAKTNILKNKSVVIKDKSKKNVAVEKSSAINEKLITKSLEAKSSYLKGLSLYKKKQYSDAKIWLYQAFVEQSDDMLTNYYLGRASFMVEDFDGALAAYERVLIKDPQNLRTKLEVAHLYYKINAFNTSKVEFQTLLKSDILPNSVRAKILRYLALIEKKTKKHFFNGTYVFGYNYDSNINSMGRKGEFSIYVPELNINVTVPNSGKKKDSVTYSHTLLFNYLYKKSDSVVLKTSLAAFRHDYVEDSNKEEDVYSFSFTPIYKYDDFNLATSFGVNSIGIDSKSFMKTYNLSQDVNKLLSDTSAYTLSAKLVKKVFSTKNKNKNAMNYELSNRISQKTETYGINDYGLIYGEDHEDKDIRTDVSFKYFTFKVNNNYKINKLYSLNTTLSLQKKYYKDKDANFLSKREDLKKDFSTGLNYSYSKKIKFSILGSYTENESNHYPFLYDKYALKSNMIVNF